MFTPTERAMLKVLSDGRRHSKDDLKCCCGPCGSQTVNFHLANIRRKLRARHEDIVCVLRHKSLWYQHVRLLASPYDGLS
jgi:DNA-binding CsgD family transcriptional regulator